MVKNITSTAKNIKPVALQPNTLCRNEMVYLFMRMGLETAPLMLGFILGPLLEEYFRSAFMISQGDFSFFYTAL